MEILVKKDILDELQAKGVCHSKDEAELFLETVVAKIAEGIADGKRVFLQEFGSFRNNKSQQDVVSTSNLIDAICGEINIEEERVKSALYAFLHYIRESILKGVEVQIIDFASFRLEERKAKIIKDVKTGRKTIAPTKKVLVFECEDSFCRKSSTRQIFFDIASFFQEQISRLRVAAVLLVIPQRDFFVKTIEYHFERAGWKTCVAQNIAEAKRYIEGGSTYLVILDTKVEKHQELCEIVKFRRDSRLVPLITIHPKGEDIKNPAELEICGDEQVIQPFEIKHLLTLAESVLRRASEEEAIFEQEVHMQLPTVDKYIEKANSLAQKLFQISGLDEDNQIALCAAFREALGNAGQHGNKHRAEKMLGVLYILDKEKITIAITDSGFGFDWQRYMDIGQGGDAVGRARQRHREGKLGGLGIMLMLRCVDRLEYNDTGNVITITKYLRK